MREKDELLYERILAFSLDEEGTALTFSRRLARENQWSQDFALRVILEYKRFVFLAMVADHPVTPSDQVDQVWHLHLTYTHSYWIEFCGKVLQKPFHHGPTKGGAVEGHKFSDWYQKTLKSYDAYFNEKPPEDIWPNPSIRFGEDLQFQRINLSRNILIPRSIVTNTIRFGLIAFTILPMWILLASPTESGWLGFLGFWGGILVSIAGFITLKQWDHPHVLVEANLEVFKLDPYEIAYLAGGEKQAANAAIASLVERNILSCHPGEHRVSKIGDSVENGHPLETTICAWMEKDSKKSIAQIHELAKPSLNHIRQRLETNLLLVSREVEFFSNKTVLYVAGALLTIPSFFIVSQFKPWTFSCFLFLIFHAICIFAVRQRWGARPFARTELGETAVVQLREIHSDLKSKVSASDPAVNHREVQMAAAVFGLAIFSGTAFYALKETIRPPVAPIDGGGGCGGGVGGCGDGGCGSGGCGGGGCGGCGGCGG